MRIGLLGGSFNPAHAGHAHIARAALRLLRLDQVWLLVSPGNPLKSGADMAPLAQRLASAKRLCTHPRLRATDIEHRLGTRFTADTLQSLRQRFPRAQFVWLMGADNLRQLPSWKRWEHIYRLMPIAVVPRPGATRPALASKAAQRLRHARLRSSAGILLARSAAPRWSLLPIRENPLSATQIRSRRQSLRSGASPKEF
jgi:nicotinate-nucleotide adenylyltransferase